MSRWHRLAVYYGLRDDERFAVTQINESTRMQPWRVAAFGAGLLVLLVVPTIILTMLLGRSFTGAELGRTALGILALLVLLVGVIAICTLRRCGCEGTSRGGQRRRGSHQDRTRGRAIGPDA